LLTVSGAALTVSRALEQPTNVAVTAVAMTTIVPTQMNFIRSFSFAVDIGFMA
jgi:hypothetical protein